MTLVQALELAAALAIPAAKLIAQLKQMGCLTCEELQPADAPDLLGESLHNRNDLARRATGTDRASVDAALDDVDRGQSGRVSDR